VRKALLALQVPKVQQDHKARQGHKVKLALQALTVVMELRQQSQLVASQLALQVLMHQ
jgi:hypothetical protein